MDWFLYDNGLRRERVNISEMKNKRNHLHSSTLYCASLFYDGGRYHIETSSLICRANQWTGFYMITASVMKELIVLLKCYCAFKMEKGVGQKMTLSNFRKIALKWKEGVIN